MKENKREEEEEEEVGRGEVAEGRGGVVGG